MWSRTLISLSFLFFAHSVGADGIAIIVNNDNPEKKLSGQHVGNIYLRRINRFPHGDKAIPLDLPQDSDLYEAFYRKVIKKSPAQMSAHWARMIFTGKGRPPKRVANMADMKNLVSQNESIIGYVNEGAVDTSVKVLLHTP